MEEAEKIEELEMKGLEDTSEESIVENEITSSNLWKIPTSIRNLNSEINAFIFWLQSCVGKTYDL